MITDNGDAGGTLTVQCNLMHPIALLEVCVVDETSTILRHAAEGKWDDATVPKCCKSEYSVSVPKACYALQIRCESSCGGDGSSGGEEERQSLRRLLRGIGLFK